MIFKIKSPFETLSPTFTSIDSIFPENIKEYLFFNPIVHINEFIRESYLGSYGGLVDMHYASYALLPILFFAMLLTLSRLHLILPK